MMKKTFHFNESIRLSDVFDGPRTDENCYYRHGIVWLLYGKGYSLKRIAKVIGKHRTTLYNSIEAHENLICTDDRNYKEIFKGICRFYHKFVTILEAKMGRDLSGVYSVDQAYEYGYEDAREKMKEILVEKIDYAKSMTDSRVKDNEDGLHLCEINYQWADFIKTCLDELKSNL